jgi:hypothetical protein
MLFTKILILHPANSALKHTALLAAKHNLILTLSTEFFFLTLKFQVKTPSARRMVQEYYAAQTLKFILLYCG